MCPTDPKLTIRMLKLGMLAGGLLHYSLMDIQKHAFPFIIAMHKYAVSVLSSVSCILSMDCLW